MSDTTTLSIGSHVFERLGALRESIPGLAQRNPRPPAGPGDAATDDWGAIQAQRPWRLLARVLAGLMLVFLAGWWIAGQVRPRQSDLDALAVKAPRVPQPFRPAYGVSAAEFAQIDMARVHRELLPAWIMAMQNEPYSHGYPEAERTFLLLKAEAGKDPNLAVLLTELHDKMMDNIRGFAADIQLLFKGWNEYLQRRGLPWRVEHHIENSPRGPVVFTRSYRVLCEVRVTADGDSHRVLLLARQDHTNLIEPFFGQTSVDHDGAIVVADRVADYAVEQLWPMFASHPRELSSLQQAFGPSVRAEIERGVGSEVVRRLRDGADARDALAADLDALKQRKGCGRTVYVDEVPWSGLSARALSKLRNAAERNARRNYPLLTLRDVERIEASSNQLASDGALEASLGRLAAFLARAVTIHEARHLADDHLAPAGERTPECQGCPGSMTPNERAELRAYLAAFGTEGLGYVSLMQACGSGPVGGPGAGALAHAFASLLPAGCRSAPPAELYARARRMEAELFGSNEPLELPTGFPESLPVAR